MSGPSWAGAVITGSLRPATGRRRTRALLIALAAALLVPASASAQAIQEFPVPAGSFPGGITAGPDGNLWFVAEGTSTIYRMTTGGAIDPPGGFQVPSGPSSIPPTDPTFVPPVDQITTGPDGALWFTQPRDDQIGRITTGGAIGEFTVPGTGPRPEAITLGPDGNLWFTAPGLNLIGRIPPGNPSNIETFPGAGAGASDITSGPDGALWFTESHETANSIGRITTGATPTVTSHFPVPAVGADPSGITQGPGGGLWFTESAANQIGQITTSGLITEYPGAGAGPSAIVVGRDGALWFTESEASSIGRITTGGVITNHFPTPTPSSEPSDITAGPDGALWFSEFVGQQIGRIETASPVTTLPLPPIKPLLPKLKPKRCTVPKLKGLTIKKAKKKLRRAKCRFRFSGKGRVVSSKPKAGKRTAKTVQVKAKPKVTRS
ncbi:MAG: virginiamycin B lyase family protein, partial [Thermoleophilaceae bacterium]